MNNYHSIDLDKIKELVLEYCAIEDSKTFILNEEVNFNPLVIKNNLKQTKEILDLLKDNFSISFDGIENLNDSFEKANKNIPLNGIELAKILSFHYHCERIKNKISNLDAELSIKDYADSIYLDNKLSKIIEKIVDTNGNIKEDASEKLYQISLNINRSLNNLHSYSTDFISKNGQYLQESNVFNRNNRTTFLLKNTYKNKFKGFQYGTSSSGLATYVEPEQFVEINNKINSLEIEKDEEVKRILKEATYYVSSVAENYILNFESLMKLDVLFAKAEFGYYKNGVVAEISTDNSLDLKDVIHPLIDIKKVVSNNYSLHKPYQGIVISGTNTGGKTVGLKLIGLSILMSYLGIPVLATSASIPLYDNVFVDIDDNQSVLSALSTFSAHISNINFILKNADERSLILIDELISGTDPKEAQAISLSILDYILKLKSDFVITTHYDDIKQFAFNNELILLSSVGFDLDNLKPTFKYIENSIGVSNALDIASRYFDVEGIIDNAYNYLNKNKSKEEELLERLALEMKETEKLKTELEESLNKNNELNINLNNKLKELEDSKQVILNKYKEELNEKLNSIKQEALNKIEEIKEANKKEDNKKIIKEIEDLIEEDTPKEEIVFEVGDNVRICEANQVGEIIEINNDNVVVGINGMSIKTKLNTLTKMPKIKKKEYQPKQRMERVSHEINLVGKRVEEALELLDKYLDSAYGCGLSSVKIIHGFGTGQLRKAIREHLKHNKTIVSIDNGDAYEGGSNVTIAKFR